ncbi:hypothetical protein A7A09_008315 [Paracoccus methylarcula]|uniref:Cytochrome P460 domain-containing protein n=2 Tax=Paracoccus methylarcula TaxID=72022 RepID=A0A422QYK8_9RHOB|nr:hypothetical protein A7A09_008315 [Paracoccus methylarcula]
MTMAVIIAIPSPAPAGDLANCTLSDPAAEVGDEDAAALYDCLSDALQEQLAVLEAGDKIDGPSWLLSDLPEARAFLSWESVTRSPYISATHGERYVVNLADPAAMPTYSRFEEGGPMPVGGILGKPSFTISDKGQAKPGPLFLMEKAEEGAFPDTGDWIYTAIKPSGALMGRTGAENSGGMQFCADCHMGIGAETDSMTYLPEEYRIGN